MISGGTSPRILNQGVNILGPVPPVAMPMDASLMMIQVKNKNNKETKTIFTILFLQSVRYLHSLHNLQASE